MANRTALVDRLTLRNEYMEVKVLPGKGADIYALVDLRTGIDVLFKSPWGRRAPGLWGGGASSRERWMEAYAGGWQVLLPNGGDECMQQGAIWGFHGEAALLSWTVLDRSETMAILEVQLFSAPLRVRRELIIDGPVLRLTETVTNESPVALEVMWSHHPAFGAPFLDGSCVLSAGCRSVQADDLDPGTLLAPGSHHQWPYVTTRDGGGADLSTVPPPAEHRALLAYLGEFSAGFFAITNMRVGVGVGLRWPLNIFSKAWLWQEMHASEGWPWFGRAYVMAVEPASTIPARGMASARAKGHAGVWIGPESSQCAVLEAVLFEGTKAVTGIDEGGSVHFT